MADGLVRCNPHPTEDLVIFNYTQKAQWTAGAWDDVTRQCRGLIVHRDGTVMARPFRKFHNLAEHQGVDAHAGPLHLEPPIAVYEKMDGSLGIAYQRPSDGKVCWATRGSFTSEQALWATAFWDTLDEPMLPDLDLNTVLAEIVYPSNRIVVDYGDTTQLVLLAVLDTATGHHLFPPIAGEPPLNTEQTWAGGTIATHMGYLDDTNVSGLPIIDNAEGFVLLSADGATRVKVKLPEYIRLHALLTNVSARTIWEHLRTGGDVDRMRGSVPDEFLAWVNKIEAELTTAKEFLEAECRLAYHDALTAARADVSGDLSGDGREFRKAFAAHASPHEHSRALFLLLDDNLVKLDTYLWAQLRPEAEVPFAQDPDEAEEVV